MSKQFGNARRLMMVVSSIPSGGEYEAARMVG